MPDRDGYPTKDELQAILDFVGTPAEFVDYINSIWWSTGFRVKRGFDDYTGVMRCELSTWGWSGNEDIIEVMKQTWFWMLWWRGSHRGGHYTFEVPTKTAWKNNIIPDSYGMPHSQIEPDHPGNVTRFEVIDHRQCFWCRGRKTANYLQKDGSYKEQPCDKCDGSGIMGGRVYSANSNAETSHLAIELSYQDGGKTLKVFVTDRESKS